MARAPCGYDGWLADKRVLAVTETLSAVRRTSPPPLLDQGRKRTMPEPTQQQNEEAHWRKTTNLMLTYLGLWLFFGYIVHMFVNVLNKITILGFPLGFYMAAQGSLIAFVTMLFLFARQQDKIDREFGFAEDE
jgi:putative solute:sodium symporter small subunit